eukprot:scpid39994/ scgid7311/ 
MSDKPPFLASSASLERVSDASSVDVVSQHEQFSCVLCKAKKPSTGKVLHCLHVICSSCLDEQTGVDGAVMCELCKQPTKPRITSVPLRGQLSDAADLLYADQSADSSSDNRDVTTTEEVVLCDFCEDDKQTKATHECLDCGGAGLCIMHTGGHTKKKAFRHHTVRRRALGISMTKVPSQGMCRLHRGTAVDNFCRTCHHTVCWRCLSSGHQSHDVLTMEQMSSMLHVKLEELVTGASSMEAGISRQMQSIVLVTTTADSTVSCKIDNLHDAFARIKKLIEDTEKQQVLEVDAQRAEHLQPLRDIQRQLNVMAARHTMTTQIADHLCKADLSASYEVLELAESVVCNAAEVQTFLSHLNISDKKQPGAFETTIDTSTAVTSIENAISDLVKIKRLQNTVGDKHEYQVIAHAPDIAFLHSKVTVLISISCRQGTTFEFDDSLVMVTVDTTSDVPGQLEPEVDMFLSDVTDTRALLKIVFVPSAPGRYQISAGYDTVESQEVIVDVADQQAFSPKDLSPYLSLSKDGLRVQHNSENTQRLGHGFGNWSHCHGTITWVLSVSSQFLSYGNLCVGVAVKTSPMPSSPKDIATWASKNAFFWRSNGEVSPSLGAERSATAETSRWVSGDTITLMLDCPKRSLSLDLHRTGERRTMANVLGLGVSLCLYVVLFDENDYVELKYMGEERK